MCKKSNYLFETDLCSESWLPFMVEIFSVNLWFLSLPPWVVVPGGWAWGSEPLLCHSCLCMWSPSGWITVLVLQGHLCAQRCLPALLGHGDLVMSLSPACLHNPFGHVYFALLTPLHCSQIFWTGSFISIWLCHPCLTRFLLLFGH